MFRLFKKKNKLIASDKELLSTANNRYDIIFRFDRLPDDYKKSNVYLSKWLKNDGEWVEEGQPLFSVHFGEPRIIATDPIPSEKSGIIQLFKHKDELIKYSDIIYSIYPSGNYLGENSILKETYHVYLDKYKYKIPDKYSHHGLNIIEWHKEDGAYIKKNDLILTFGYSTSYGNKETINDYAEKDGYLDRVTHYGDLYQNDLIYLIHDNDEDRIKRKFNRIPVITTDDFTGKKTIKWEPGGDIISYSNDDKVFFTFSFNNIDEKDFIVFKFFSEDFMLSKDDKVSFLFDDNKIIDFEIISKSYKILHPNKKNFFENKVPIMDEELRHFEEQIFLKWKIILKQDREIIGGNADDYHYFGSVKNLTMDINNLAKEYRKIVRFEIPNYSPLLNTGLLSTNDNDLDEECYVYLMIDTNNNYHKIGISNKPGWREKTLQSEKPTIELICAKKFVSRKIATSFEKALHDTYAEKRIRGEWFQLDLKEIEEIKITLKN